MIDDLKARTLEHGNRLIVEPEAIDFMVKEGFHPSQGARGLRREGFAADSKTASPKRYCVPSPPQAPPYARCFETATFI